MQTDGFTFELKQFTEGMVPIAVYFDKYPVQYTGSYWLRTPASSSAIRPGSARPRTTHTSPSSAPGYRSKFPHSAGIRPSPSSYQTRHGDQQHFSTSAPSGATYGASARPASMGVYEMPAAQRSAAELYAGPPIVPARTQRVTARSPTPIQADTTPARPIVPSFMSFKRRADAAAQAWSAHGETPGQPVQGSSRPPLVAPRQSSSTVNDPRRSSKWSFKRGSDRASVGSVWNHDNRRPSSSHSQGPAI